MEQPVVYMNPGALVDYRHENDQALVNAFLSTSPENQALLLDTFKILGSSFGIAGYVDMKHTFKALRHGLKTCLNVKAGFSQHLDKIISSETSPEDSTKSLNKIIGYIADPICFLKSVVFLTHKPHSQASALVKSLDLNFDTLCDLKKPLTMSVSYADISRIYQVASKNKLSIAKNGSTILGIALNLTGCPYASLAMDVVSYGCSVAQFVRAKSGKG